MENASKALIIAGGVLISIIAISLFTYMYGSISTLVSSSETDYQAEEISTFNSGFEAYNKKLMYGTDVISVYNKAEDNNTNYRSTSGDEYYVEIFVSTTEGSVTTDTCVSLMDNPSIMNGTYGHNVTTTEGGYTITAWEEKEFKRCTFQCIQVDYNSYGRVSALYFAIVW